ncbi:hypothetical protein VYI11_01835 [Streptococcus anginosus]|uniref:hypothetical protein n=2 Tax=Streptococcus anginosus TaxID=1328 RepID=UPI0024AE9231|nr:hypothetical protein [Streptococcus anginosus]MCW1082733.1 hypothetical protein [Streptococcus anginosus]MDI7734859.1 hypothetical protein [Streptococcus anginosus]MED5921430.1 hypothetical protein [Streptococcus anginosus]MED5940030.1 hypothetical protein [Streptococcus anginosus]MED5941476.1 hypothetical protein [Streptococcus anginosus]
MDILELMINDFDYSVLDVATKEFLEERANIIYGIQSKSAYEIGKQLAQAQENLSAKGYGCFEEWYRGLGFKTTKAYEYINHFKFVSSQNEETKIEMFERLPKSLQAQMSKPSANPEINQAVFSGDIKTHKEYKELERRLKLKDQANEALRDENERLKLKSTTKEVVKEVVPDDYTATKQLNNTLLEKNKNLVDELDSVKRSLKLKEASYQLLEKETSEAIALKDSLEHLKADKQKLEASVANVFELSNLAAEFETFFDEKMAPLRFKALIQGAGKEIQIDKIRQLLTLTENWLSEMNKVVPEKGRTIVEGEIVNE